MKTVRNLFVIAVAVCVPVAAHANGLLYKLPADGATVVYDWTLLATKPQQNKALTGTRFR